MVEDAQYNSECMSFIGIPSLFLFGVFRNVGMQTELQTLGKKDTNGRQSS